MTGSPFLSLALLLAGSASAAEKPAVFHRGLNLNGPALVIDGNRWDGKDAKNYTADGHVLDNQVIALKPETDRNRARMIRSSVWGNNVKVTLTEVPNGIYQVFLYVWEDNNAVNFSVSLNGKVVRPRYDSRSAGQWEKLGPWKVQVSDGKIQLTSSGGDANFSGVEVWSGEGEIPKSAVRIDAAMTKPPTTEQLEFFEKKIRPLFVKHCYGCHSTEAGKVRGDLLLDTRAGLLKGGATGPAIVPGSPDESLLLTAVRYEDEVLRMPPKVRLTRAEVADLEAWVKMGAPDPRTGSAAVQKGIDFDAARKFWSFQPVRDPAPPAVKDATWPRTALDRFVLAKLEAKGLRPAPLADRRTLLRRATFDLTGLPPTPDEVADFLSDESPDAWEKVIDRLLASPHYGERWGRHWLDLVRYADTSGCNSDFPVPTAYLYRNYVIAAFNRDMPYDQFLREQVAGDLLPHRSEQERHEHVIAGGYLAIGRRFGSLADEFHLTIEDNIDNLGKATLGLSISCARCHDHKFDPVPQHDYYALYGIFESTRYAFPGTEIPPEPKDFVPLAPPEFVKTVLEPFERQLADLQKEVDRLNRQKEAIRKGQKPKPGENPPTLEEATAAWEAAKKRRDELLAKRPAVLEAYAVQEGKPHNARVQKKGDPRQLGEEVPRGFLRVLGGQKLSSGETGSGRLQLAQWLTDRGNPLTARVMVNRVWQYHFGQGLVRTPNDFGSRGTPPTHPELLDYLATRFMANGWSLKAMHRLIMTSQAYQMACVEDARSREADVRNELLWTFPRRRLSAEEFRDALLATSGQLDRTPGDAHPFPPAPLKFTQHKPFYAVYDTNRRSVYLMQQRIRKHPWLEVFDGADPNAITAERPLNTTPIQALFAMNDEFVHRTAGALADRLLREPSDDGRRVESAYRLTFGRAPTMAERELCADFLRDCRAALRETKQSPEQRERAAWASLARVVYCSNEFAFVD